MKEWLGIFGWFLGLLVGFALLCVVSFAPLFLAIETDSQWLGVISMVWIVVCLAGCLATLVYLFERNK